MEVEETELYFHSGFWVVCLFQHLESIAWEEGYFTARASGSRIACILDTYTFSIIIKMRLLVGCKTSSFREACTWAVAIYPVRWHEIRWIQKTRDLSNRKQNLSFTSRSSTTQTPRKESMRSGASLLHSVKFVDPAAKIMCANNRQTCVANPPRIDVAPDEFLSPEPQLSFRPSEPSTSSLSRS